MLRVQQNICEGCWEREIRQVQKLITSLSFSSPWWKQAALHHSHALTQYTDNDHNHQIYILASFKTKSFQMQLNSYFEIIQVKCRNLFLVFMTSHPCNTTKSVTEQFLFPIQPRNKLIWGWKVMFAEMTDIILVFSIELVMFECKMVTYRSNTYLHFSPHRTNLQSTITNYPLTFITSVHWH